MLYYVSYILFKDPNETLTDNNNTITEDNYESRDQVQSEKIEQKSIQKSQSHTVSRNTQHQRHSKSASQNIKSDQTVSRDNRHKSAPIHRNQYGHSRHELTRNYDQSVSFKGSVPGS